VVHYFFAVHNVKSYRPPGFPRRYAPFQIYDQACYLLIIEPCSAQIQFFNKHAMGNRR
jgi:hypothetical protein